MSHKIFREWRVWFWYLPLLYALYLEMKIFKYAQGFPIDDAYIYSRYIHNLTQGFGLGFNPGEFSAGIPGFLYVILCAGVSIALPSLDLFLILQFMGIFWYLVLIFLTQKLIHDQTNNLILSLLGGILLALCRPLYFTALAGLETPLFLTLMVFTCWLALREPPVSPVWLGATCALVCLTRLEGVAIAMGYCFFILLGAFVFNKQMKGSFVKSLFELIYFLSGFILVTLPFALFIYIKTGFWLPTDYYGELLNRNGFSTLPTAAHLEKGFLAIFNGYSEILTLDSTSIIYCGLFALSGVSLLIFIYRCGEKPPSLRFFAARSTMFSLILWPFLYGFFFKFDPQFGRQYIHYLQIVIVIIHIEAIVGVNGILRNAVQYIPYRSLQFVIVCLCAYALSYYTCKAVISTARQSHKKELTSMIDRSREHEQIYKQAALWIRSHTPPGARILTGLMGPGAIGYYSGRYVIEQCDWAGAGRFTSRQSFSLDDPQQKRSYWKHAMETMRLERVNYFVSSASMNITQDTRFAREILTLSDSKRKNVYPVIHQKAFIYHFDAPEEYILWDEHPQFIDRAKFPITEGRMISTFWHDIPIVAVDVREVTSELRYNVILPDRPHLVAGAVLDFPPRDYTEEETVHYTIHIELEEKKDIIYTKTFQMNQAKPRDILTEFDIDLKSYSGRHAALVFSLSVPPKKYPGKIWAGWVHPRILNKMEGGRPARHKYNKI